MPSQTPSRILQRYVDALVKAVPHARDGDEHAVHQARVASRRLREALPVLAPDDGAARRARKRVRRVTRALGPVRELDVALQHLAEFEGLGAAPAGAIAAVRRVLVQQRGDRRRAMLEMLTPGRLEKLRTPLGAADVTSSDAAGAAAASARRIIVRAERLTAAIEHAGSLYLPDRLHLVRIACKKLRYALELQREIRPTRATARIRQLKGAQELLGRMHDLEVLLDRVRATAAEKASVNRLIALDLDRLVRALEGECRALHARFMARRAALLRLCELVRWATVSRAPAA